MDFSIEISKDGYRLLKVDNDDSSKRYLGNRYNQKREIENFIAEFGHMDEKDNYIVFGLFFGDHIERLLEISNDKSKILIVEHNKKIIDFGKNDNKVRNILNNSRITLATDNDDIKSFFKSNINEMNIGNLKILEYCSYYNIYRNYLYDKYDFIKKEITRITLNRNTVLKTNDITFDNFLNNLEYISKSTPVNELKDKYKGIPAIIVSAGPSLNKNIDYLKQDGKRLVLSGGRTLKALINKNIIPDCVGSVDFSERAYQLVEGYLNEFEIPLVVSDKTNYKILEEHIGNKFFFSENYMLDDIWGYNIEELFGGGSIAHSLTLLALYMGCNPIVFIGQDLAYTNDKKHDILAEDRWKNNDDYKNTYHKDSDIYI